MKLRHLVLSAAVILLASANVAVASPFDDLDVGDLVTVEILLSPKAYRVTEQSFGPGDVQADFVTYCVETQGPIANGNFIVTGFGNDIDPRTAYLYSKYRDGLIPPGYSADPLPPTTPGTPPLPLRPEGLQDAIDFIEGAPGEGVNNSFVTDANCAVFGTGPGCAGATWAGLGNIFVLQIQFADGPRAFTDAQDLLVRLTTQDTCVLDPSRPQCQDIPTPEPGSLILFGSGLVGLGLVAKRRRAFAV